MNIKLSKHLLKYNKHHVTGGFIGLPARAALPMAAKILPQVGKHLALGSLAGVATNLVNKVFGKGLYFKKGGCVCKIKDDRGEGLYLKPMRTNEEYRGKTTVVTKSDFLSYPPSPISPLLKIVTV